MPTSGITPASTVRFAYCAFGWVTAVVSPVAEPAIVNDGVSLVLAFTAVDGLESVAEEVPALLEVKA